jgi:hypothetical protein
MNVRREVEKKIAEGKRITLGEILQGKFTREEQFYVCAKLHEAKECHREAVYFDICPSCPKHRAEASVEWAKS